MWKCGKARHKAGQQLVLWHVEAIFDVPQSMPKLWYTDIGIDNGVSNPKERHWSSKLSSRSSGMSIGNATAMTEMKGEDRSASWAKAGSSTFNFAIRLPALSSNRNLIKKTTLWFSNISGCEVLQT